MLGLRMLSRFPIQNRVPRSFFRTPTCAQPQKCPSILPGSIREKWKRTQIPRLLLVHVLRRLNRLFGAFAFGCLGCNNRRYGDKSLSLGTLSGVHQVSYKPNPLPRWPHATLTLVDASAGIGCLSAPRTGGLTPISRSDQRSRLRLGREQKPCRLAAAGNLLDLWIASYPLPSSTRSLGVGLGRYQPVTRLDRPQPSSARGVHAAKFGGLTARSLSRRTTSWETQWGQLNRSRSVPPPTGVRGARGWVRSVAPKPFTVTLNSTGPRAGTPRYGAGSG